MWRWPACGQGALTARRCRCSCDRNVASGDAVTADCAVGLAGARVQVTVKMQVQAAGGSGCGPSHILRRPVGGSGQVGAGGCGPLANLQHIGTTASSCRQRCACPRCSTLNGWQFRVRPSRAPCRTVSSRRRACHSDRLGVGSRGALQPDFDARPGRSGHRQSGRRLDADLVTDASDIGRLERAQAGPLCPCAGAPAGR